MTRTLAGCLSLDDFEAAARRHLPGPLFGFVAGAAETGTSADANRRAFARHALVPRVLRDVSARQTGVTLFGNSHALPFGIAPMGISALTAYLGDVVQARAAAALGMPMILSGSSLIRMETVIAHHPQAWFQAYVPGDTARIEALLERVRQAGFGTLVVTADVPISGNRENNVRCGFSTPLRPSWQLAWQGATHPRWLCGTALRTLARHGMPHFENASAARGAPILSRRAVREFDGRDNLGWTHLAHIRQRWPGKLVVKGILHADDARLARDAGADGIIVSNHGGRQLDHAPAALDRLPGIAQAVGADLAVMVDGGLRRGTDVLKAYALGARMVFLGRPFNYAAAVAGEAGVRHAATLLAQEVARDMALLGIRQLDELDPSWLAPA
ncbi:L-lactate dehydrogenase [plant metagenome]|uniref:L-lactate dehydrogenase n=1 Tax=plant metagenome TaxID=1297885 RepID=A0A484XJW6_9ZZZZ